MKGLQEATDAMKDLDELSRNFVRDSLPDEFDDLVEALLEDCEAHQHVMQLLDNARTLADATAMQRDDGTRSLRVVMALIFTGKSLEREREREMTRLLILSHHNPICIFRPGEGYKGSLRELSRLTHLPVELLKRGLELRMMRLNDGNTKAVEDALERKRKSFMKDEAKMLYLHEWVMDHSTPSPIPSHVIKMKNDQGEVELVARRIRDDSTLVLWNKFKVDYEQHFSDKYPCLRTFQYALASMKFLRCRKASSDLQVLPWSVCFLSTPSDLLPFCFSSPRSSAVVRTTRQQGRCGSRMFACAVAFTTAAAPVVAKCAGRRARSPARLLV